jgi:hypothetical protein
MEAGESVDVFISHSLALWAIYYIYTVSVLAVKGFLKIYKINK